jgi:CelD/BcsL family acetyltransferase involved in cellulose biosynthesis
MPTRPLKRVEPSTYVTSNHEINIEDLVVSLPHTVKEYDAALGRNMRRNIKRNTNALLKDYPSYRFRFYHEGDISEQHVPDIVSLSCLRMKSKNIEPRFNEEETRWIIDYAQKCGIAGVATIDGRVCAGIIGFRMGQGYFMHVIAHDLRFNEYSLGILCCYHAICEAIVRAAKGCHLLQGRYGYKYRLLAERQDIVHLDIYRNRLCSFFAWAQGVTQGNQGPNLARQTVALA